MDLVDYVRREGLLSFDEKPMNDIDGVILAQLAYLDFDYLYARAVHGIADLTTNTMVRTAVEGTWNPDGNFRLVQALRLSHRFSQVTWSAYKNNLDMAQEQQFTAIVLHLDEKRHYLAFRGTSAALVDWKEDLNMTFLQAIPSQLSALRYLQKSVHRYKGDFYLGGHSKGGNLAIYAAVNAPESVKKLIKGVYSVDGPGIKQSIPADMTPVIHKLIPESSVVGLLLEPDKNYSVVVSDARGIQQHDPFTWNVEDDHFLTVGAISGFSRFTENSVSEWLEQVDDETKQEFLRSLFAVFHAAHFSQVLDVIDDVPRTLRIVNRGVRGMDEAEQLQWHSVVDAFVSSVVSQARERLGVQAAGLMGNVKDTLQRSGSAVQRSVNNVRNSVPSLNKPLLSLYWRRKAAGVSDSDDSKTAQ
ncbi:MAG: DUF2974 domain-containing protein [Bifidobacteriaceae bacterium]|jgi:pimeloyl-ACP methyl ester carboxylesterase|nr:DUF2974 domain-containing protein [Bifidobacteriaceae bacterium]MCI1978570.1 DUF2974 domain-containing protein [Bifidobacteriaceae bacterium]